MPHGSQAAFQLRYPINFVVKHHPPLYERPALRRLKPTDVRLILLAAAVCFQIGFSSEKAIWKQRMEFGGADRDRTGDPLLAKQVLSQLSYSPLEVLWLRWWAWVDSNYRPHPYQGCALTN